MRSEQSWLCLHQSVKIGWTQRVIPLFLSIVDSADHSGGREVSACCHKGEGQDECDMDGYPISNFLLTYHCIRYNARASVAL